MAFDKSKYDQEYNKDHIRRVFVAFNDANHEDQELLSWIDQQGNKTQYIKRLIRDDMTRKTADSLSKRLSKQNDNGQDA